MIRILIAEDSPTTRGILREILTSDAEIEIVGEARDGNEAVALATSLRPDVVTMDILMPGLDGFEATERILASAPSRIVIVSALSDVSESEAVGRALSAGALAVLRKPPSLLSPDFPAAAKELLVTVKTMSRVLLRPPPRSTQSVASKPASPPSPAPAPAPRSPAEIVTIVASTGGPQAIQNIVAAIPSSFRPPILIVQQITAGFIDSFVFTLKTHSRLNVRLAKHTEPLAPGTIYIAPDDLHLGVDEKQRVHLTKAPKIGGFRPSANFLFESAATAFGPSAVGLVLTGWSEDGIDGLRKLQQAGGYVIAQDERSSILFDLPRAAIEAGVTDEVLPLSGIAPRLMQLARG